jgi:hypothetical protein
MRGARNPAGALSKRVDQEGGWNGPVRNQRELNPNERRVSMAQLYALKIDADAHIVPPKYKKLLEKIAPEDVRVKIDVGDMIVRARDRLGLTKAPIDYFKMFYNDTALYGRFRNMAAPVHIKDKRRNR